MFAASWGRVGREEEVPIKPACLLKQVSAGGETAVCLKKMYPALQFINLSSVMEQYGGKVWWKSVVENCQNVKMSNCQILDINSRH